MMTDELREKISRQLVLEDESRSLGAERYRSQRPLPWRDSAAGVSEEGELPPGRQLIRQVIPPVAQAILDFTDRVAEGGAGRRPAAFKILGFVEPEVAAYLAARVVVNGAVFGHAVQTTAFEVAEALVHHIEMTQLKDANKKGYKGLLKAQEKAGFSSKKRAALKKIMDKEGTRFLSDQSDRLHAGMKSDEVLVGEAQTQVRHLLTFSGEKRWKKTVRKTAKLTGLVSTVSTRKSTIAHAAARK